MKDKREFSAWLRKVREDAGLSPSAVAEKIGEGAGTYAHWERGGRAPTRVQCRKLAPVLGLSDAEIWARASWARLAPDEREELTGQVEHIRAEADERVRVALAEAAEAKRAAEERAQAEVEKARAEAAEAVQGAGAAEARADQRGKDAEAAADERVEARIREIEAEHDAWVRKLNGLNVLPSSSLHLLDRVEALQIGRHGDVLSAVSCLLTVEDSDALVEALTAFVAIGAPSRQKRAIGVFRDTCSAIAEAVKDGIQPLPPRPLDPGGVPSTGEAFTPEGG